MTITRPITFSRAGVRALDAAAINELGIPGILLMENAGASIEHACIRKLGGHAGAHRVAVFCGPGNNGGDGYALARRLHVRNIAVSIVACSPVQSLVGDALTNARITRRLSMDWTELDPSRAAEHVQKLLAAARGGRVLVVDALFGSGLTRPLKPPFDTVVNEINAARRASGGHIRVLAVDLPSGLDCDWGEPLGGVAIEADLTVTLAGMKRGFANPASARFTGNVEVGGIGVPAALLERFADPN